MKSCELLEKNPEPTREEVKAALAGNLCRCTGFMKIYDAVDQAAGELRGKRSVAPQPVKTA
jgi:carbon-monoxide dehydrogenase small subunit